MEHWLYQPIKYTHWALHNNHSSLEQTNHSLGEKTETLNQGKNWNTKPAFHYLRPLINYHKNNTFPLITHLDHTYPLPTQKHESINRIISLYIAGPIDPALPMSTLSKNREYGSYNIADIPSPHNSPTLKALPNMLDTG